MTPELWSTPRRLMRSAGKVVSVAVLGVVGVRDQCRRGARRLRGLRARLGQRCPGIVASLREGGEEILTVFRFPKAQWKALRTTNVIERIHEEFRRRVKTQGSLPNEDAAVVLLFSLVACGQTSCA